MVSKNLSKLTASILSLALIFPSSLMSAAGEAGHNTETGQTVQQKAADYTGHWAEKDFRSWVNNGWISGYGNGVFKPDQAITRAEWVLLVNRVFNLQTEIETVFTDVKRGESYYVDIKKAVAAGYVSGYSDGTFRPAQTVSRQEAAVMLFRLFQLNAADGGTAPKDASELPSWSKEAVLTMLGSGYLGGYEDGSFKGALSITRAEALRMISNLAGEIIQKSGTYSDLTARNLVIGGPGVELKNTIISGNLYLTEGLGEGEVTLDNVKVAGKIFVTGGGENSVILNNSTTSELVVRKKNGKLRIVTKGTSAIPNVRVQSGVKLEEDAAATGPGFGKIIVENSLPASAVIQLSGSFDSLEQQATGEPALHLLKGTITEVLLMQKALLRVDATAEIKNLIVDVNGTIVIKGGGKVAYDDKYKVKITIEAPAATATATAGAVTGGNSTVSPTPTPAANTPAFTNVSVHDPSIVKEGGTFYVFGSHIEAAKSDDLMNWSVFTNGYTTPDNAIYGDLSANLAGSFAWAGENDSDSKGGFSVWAPYVLWNADYLNEDGTKGAYLIYYSTSSTYIRSAIGFAVSQNIEGPYTYVDTIVYSGFTKDEAYDANSKVNKKWTNTNIQKLIDDGTLQGENPGWFDAEGAYMNKIYTNAIDPNLFYDKDGTLWMTYGSWSGGIYILEMDPVTGEPKYPGKDGTTADGRLIDRYFGTKISGGNYKSGEGPYVVYDKSTDYYYLYVTYGGLASDGGYNMRLFRSKHPDGPYKDASGQDAVLSTDGDHSAIGNKLIGNFLFSNLNGESDFPAYGYVSSGHNSVLFDEESGKLFNFFHARFPFRGETHELRVHQMFMNEDAWPVVAPHRYAGETLRAVDKNDLYGAYQFVNHGKDTSAKIKPTIDVELLANGTISGSVTGTWELKDDYYANLLINETEKGSTVQRLYKGVFIKQWDSTRLKSVMTFTAMSDQGVAVWGSQMEKLSDKQLAANIAQGLTLGDTSKVYTDLDLPDSGIRGAVITWTSSNPEVVSNDGIVNRPPHGSGNATVELIASVTLGKAVATKAFTVVVVEQSDKLLDDGLIAAYEFDGTLDEREGRLAAGTVTGNRINNTEGKLAFGEGKDGQAVQLDGNSGVRLPDGLIQGSSYTLSLWLNPEELKAYTTAFFGAASNTNWISLLPYGNAGATTRMWFGSDTWLDADTGLQIPAGQWSHVAFTYDAGMVKMYVNGVLKYTGSGFTDVFSEGSGVFALGVNYWDAPYKGLIDQLRIYEKALTPEAVGWLVNGEPDLNVKVTSISFAEAEKSISLRNTYSTSASVLPANAGNPKLMWSSSDPGVASVDPVTGVVTALTLGKSVITATAADGSGVTGSYNITVTDGKVAYYTFDGNLNDSLGRSGAGRVTGAKVDSATVGTVTYGAGVRGQAAVFNGLSGIRLPDGLIHSSSYSVSLWLNPEQLTNYTTAFFGARTTSQWISFVPQIRSEVSLLWANAVYEATAGLIIPTNEWTHVAFTFNSGTVKVYIDGVEKFSGVSFPDVFTNQNGVFTLGVNYWDTPFQGKMDELKIFSNVLTPEEVLAESKAGSVL